MVPLKWPGSSLVQLMMGRAWGRNTAQTALRNLLCGRVLQLVRGHFNKAVNMIGVHPVGYMKYYNTLSASSCSIQFVL